MNKKESKGWFRKMFGSNESGCGCGTQIIPKVEKDKKEKEDDSPKNNAAKKSCCS